LYLTRLFKKKIGTSPTAYRGKNTIWSDRP
jgi:YesN/AraC family two-component response regulator